MQISLVPTETATETQDYLEKKMIKAAHCYIVLHHAIGDTMSTAEIIYYAVGNT